MAKWRETLLLQTTNMKFFTWFALVCCVAHRLDNFVVGLTNVDPSKTPPVFKSSYRVCGQYGGRVAVAANATITCSPTAQKFRFVIVQSSHRVDQAMCLTEVYVFVWSKFQSIIIVFWHGSASAFSVIRMNRAIQHVNGKKWKLGC